MVDIELCCCYDSLTIPEYDIEHTTPDTLRFGRHTAVEKSLLSTIEKSPTTSQFFIAPKISYKTRTTSKAEKRKILDHCMEHNKTFYCHVPYIVYLGRDLNSSSEAEAQLYKSMKCVKEHLDVVCDLPGCCVLHAGTVGTTERLATRLNDLQIPRNIYTNPGKYIAVETGAGRNNELFSSWDQIRKLFEALDSNTVGICADTQHIFANGMCNFTDHESVVNFFEDIYAVSGLKSPTVFHLNESVVDFGCCADKHGAMLENESYIWRGECLKSEGFMTLFDLAKEHGTDIVQETQSLEPTAYGICNDHYIIKSSLEAKYEFP